jgi:hypothetical protein
MHGFSDACNCKFHSMKLFSNDSAFVPPGYHLSTRLRLWFDLFDLYKEEYIYYPYAN